jgi:hypothetical protein
MGFLLLYCQREREREGSYRECRLKERERACERTRGRRGKEGESWDKR